ERDLKALPLVQQVLYLPGNLEEALAFVVVLNYLLERLQYLSIGYYGGTSANAASCQTACKVTENALDTAGCRGILAADGWRGKYVVCLGQPPQQVELDRGQHLVLADEIDTASK